MYIRATRLDTFFLFFKHNNLLKYQYALCTFETNDFNIMFTYSVITIPVVFLILKLFSYNRPDQRISLWLKLKADSSYI